MSKREERPRAAFQDGTEAEQRKLSRQNKSGWVEGAACGAIPLIRRTWMTYAREVGGKDSVRVESVFRWPFACVPEGDASPLQVVEESF
jgi:hypothetical protein